MYQLSRGEHIQVRRFGPLVVGILSVCMLSSCAAFRQSPPSAATGVSSSIAWLNVPTSMPTAVLPPPQETSPCVAADLQLASQNAGAYHGDATENLILSNSSTEPCYLSGVPQVTVHLTGGAAVGASSSGFATQRVVLVPSQRVSVLLGSPGACANVGRPQVASFYVVSFGAAGGAIQTPTASLDIQCGAPTVLDFEALAANVEPSSTTHTALSALSALQARIHASGHASVGATYSYAVEVTNPTSSPISFSPCPSFSESISTTSGLISQRTFLLNCDAAPEIKAGSTLTFDMELQVPSTFPVGRQKLSWQMQAPGPAAGCALQVTG